MLPMRRSSSDSISRAVNSEINNPTPIAAPDVRYSCRDRSSVVSRITLGRTREGRIVLTDWRALEPKFSSLGVVND